MAGPYYASTTEETSTSILGITVQHTDPLVKLVSTGSIIDVVNDFAWSISPRNLEGLKKVPVMYLQEREQVQNSLVSSALYYFNAFKTSVKNQETLNMAITKLDSLFSAMSLGQTYNLKDNIFEKFLNKIKIDTGNDEGLLNDKLKSYIGIYLTKPTGFNYALPFFNETPLRARSNWGYDQGLLSDGNKETINLAQQAVEETAALFNITQPGTFIEKPKYFQYNNEGESVTVSFPLFNTIKKTDKLTYQQNYELLWILAFQNKPYRTSFASISPPKLYSLTIPGQTYMPYCYISSMDISFGGTRRNLPVTIPAPSQEIGAADLKAVDNQGPVRSVTRTVEVAIPDVYMVTLTFTSLLADVANTMVDSGFTGRKIRTGTI